MQNLYFCFCSKTIRILGIGRKRGGNQMEGYIKTDGLQVAKILYDFVNQEALPGTGIDRDHFWVDFGKLVSDLAPKNKALLTERDNIQQQMDTWHKENKTFDFDKYKAFLEEIGYIEKPVEDFKITTENID